MLNRRSFLVNAFEEYHQIIFKYRKKIRESMFFSPSDNEEEKVNKIYLLQSTISNFIKSKSSEIIREAGKIGGDIFEEVGYVMASLADEVFIVLHWDGREYWKNNLLEQRLFNSNSSGEVIFNKVNFVLHDNSIESYELSLIYFYCLSLGFQGFMQGLDDGVEKINELKSKLYYKIFSKDSKVFKEKLSLFPSAYQNVFSDKKILFNNPVLFWRKAIFVSVIIYIAYVEFCWNYYMKHFFDLLGCFIR